MKARHDIQAIGSRFDVPGIFLGAEPCGTGHINDTYAATYDMNGGGRRRFIHQRINHEIFKNPVAMMDNILRVTGHLRERLAADPAADAARETLTLVRTRDGGTHFRDDCPARDDKAFCRRIFLQRGADGQILAEQGASTAPTDQPA